MLLVLLLALPVVGGTSVAPCPEPYPFAKSFKERPISTGRAAITAAREQAQEFNKAEYSERIWQRSLKGFRFNENWIVNGKLGLEFLQFQLRADNGRLKCTTIFD